jgi:enoyl-CoA hydratase/carnithine racemase
MTPTRADPSENGRAPAGRSSSWAHVVIDRRSCADCRVTFDHPPGNAVTARTVAELAELAWLIEGDAELNVVVFDSAHPDVFLADHEAEAPGTGEWGDVLARIARLPVITVASIRGRTRGAGTEFVLACDLRFASRERASLGGFAPGDGTQVARLSRLVGRSRALEILLAADEVDGERAAHYGYVNRAVAEDRLDGDVEEIAARLACLDHDAVARAKRAVARVL